MSARPGILAVGTANPSERYTQEEIYDLICRYSSFYRSERIRHIFMNSDIDFRHLSFDIRTMDPRETPDELHRRFRTGSVQVGREAIERCLFKAGRTPTDIDCIIVVSCTGYLCPGLSSLLTKELNLRTDIQRADLLGMGCAGALPGLQRAYDFVTAHPGKIALLLTVEICSACYYIDDALETVVGNAICADGAAAALIGMTEELTVPKIEGFETLLEPSLIDTVGFEQREGKLRIILSKDVRDIAGSLGNRVITDLLSSHGLAQDRIAHWILHSGGRKVIDNLQQALHLSDARVRHSKRVLRQFGNMSSPTVLFVLQETIEHANVRAGDLGVMLAMGPGLALEAALLRW